MILYPAAMRNNLNQNLRSLLSLRFNIVGYEELNEESAQTFQNFPIHQALRSTAGLRPTWEKWYQLRAHGDLSYIAGDAPQIMGAILKEARSYSVYFGTEEKPSDFNIFGQGMYTARSPQWVKGSILRKNPASTGHQAGYEKWKKDRRR